MSIIDRPLSWGQYSAALIATLACLGSFALIFV